MERGREGEVRWREGGRGKVERGRVGKDITSRGSSVQEI